MQIFGFFNPFSFEFIYSRHQHDMIYDSHGNFMDGGQGTKFYRVGGPDMTLLNQYYILLEDVKHSDLINDYNTGANRLGKLDMAQCNELFSNKTGKGSRILEPSEVQDVDSFEWKKNNKVWGTYGKEGRGPMRYKNIVDLDTDHIEAILKTQLHVVGELREIFKSVLKDRGI